MTSGCRASGSASRSPDLGHRRRRSTAAAAGARCPARRPSKSGCSPSPGPSSRRPRPPATRSSPAAAAGFILGGRPGVLHVQLHAALDARVSYLRARVEELPRTCGPTPTTPRSSPLHVRRPGPGGVHAEPRSGSTGWTSATTTCRSTPGRLGLAALHATSSPSRREPGRRASRVSRQPTMSRGLSAMGVPQLPPLLDRPADLAGRHLDGQRGPELADPAAHQRPGRARAAGRLPVHRRSWSSASSAASSPTPCPSGQRST